MRVKVCSECLEDYCTIACDCSRDESGHTPGPAIVVDYHAQLDVLEAQIKELKSLIHGIVNKAEKSGTIKKTPIRRRRGTGLGGSGNGSGMF